MTQRARVAVIFCAALLVHGLAVAQWRDVGAMSAAGHDAHSATFRGAAAVAQVSAITPDVVRVRIAQGRSFGRDHSYALAGPLPAAAATVRVDGRMTRVETANLRAIIQLAPFRIGFEDASGDSLDEDDPQHGIAFAGTTLRVWKRLRDDEHVYGLGEKNGRLDKRGRQLGGYSYAMWNSDTFAYGLDTDPIYVSVPFFIVIRNGKAHGVFFDNTFRSSFDIGHSSQGLLSFGADGGELNYYFIAGPSVEDVVRRYTDLTGRIPLPPIWALGYNQCRYSYYPESRVRFIAENFRERQIPADTIWLDIHYMDRYRPFTWDPKRFPNPAAMIRDLRNEGFRVVTIIDPHPAKVPGTTVYDTGLAGGHFVKNPDGTVYEAPVWPSQAETDPRPSVFPDFSRPATREWWGALYKSLLDVGVAGIWNDMNEPAVFAPPTGTMPLDVRHDNEGQPTDHREIHNVYGQLMSRSTYEGLLRLRPDERPFVLTRATFAGGQRFSASWPGDNVSDWDHLQGSISMLLGMGLSGLSFVGVDIGGFAGVPSAELYTRWLQAGVFYPFMRTHTTFGTPDQEPWSYGTRHEAINRRAIELRYELLPEIYNVMQESSTTGLPAMRPLLLHYSDDPATYDIDDEFLFGRDLLIAPVMTEGATSVSPYLPKGDWYDFWSGRRYDGGRRIEMPVTIESIPIFVRGGAFLFRSSVIQHTGERAGQPLRVTVFPSNVSSAVLYEDDGATRAYERGAWMRREFRQARTATDITITVGAPEGSYRPAARAMIIEVRADREPQAVVLNGSTVAKQTSTAAGDAPSWTFDPAGYLIVRQRDTFAPIQIQIR